jgi:hypothetical protein
MFSAFALAVDAFTLLALHRQRTAIIVQVVTDLSVHRLHEIILAQLALATSSGR